MKGFQEGWEKGLDEELSEPYGDYKLGDKGGPSIWGYRDEHKKARGHNEIHPD